MKMLLCLPVRKFDKDFDRRSSLEPLRPASQTLRNSVRRNFKGLTQTLLQAYEQNNEEERKSKQEFQRAFLNVYGSVSQELESKSLSMDFNRFRSAKGADITRDDNPYVIEGRILL